MSSFDKTGNVHQVFPSPDTQQLPQGKVLVQLWGLCVEVADFFHLHRIAFFFGKQ